MKRSTYLTRSIQRAQQEMFIVSGGIHYATVGDGYDMLDEADKKRATNAARRVREVVEQLTVLHKELGEIGFTFE